MTNTSFFSENTFPQVMRKDYEVSGCLRGGTETSGGEMGQKRHQGPTDTLGPIHFPTLPRAKYNKGIQIQQGGEETICLP